MELKLIKLKLFFQKLWAFIKLYAFELVAGAIAIYVVLFVKNKSDVIEQLLKEQETARQAYQENIDGLTKQLESEVSKRQKIERDHAVLLRSIDARHDAELTRIAQVRDKEIKSLITEHQNNPRLMAQTINNLFGIPMMEVPAEKQTWEQ